MSREGVYYDLPEADYHGDPDSLSVSGMKLLLKSPALYQHRLTHPEYRDVFDFGSAAHARVLGVGAEIVVVDADGWRTKEARLARAHAREEGKVALLVKDAAVVEEMAKALAGHRLAMQLLTDGQPEVSAFWHDQEWGITRRARFDYTTNIVVDYKTCATAQPRQLPKRVCDLGYDMQASNYLDVATGVGLDPAAFCFIFQEKDPPYQVVVAEIDQAFLDRGRRRVDKALAIYRDCVEADAWPGYIPDNDYITLTPPPWADRDEE